MSYYKRFTDFCAGFAAFTSFMFVLVGFLGYDFEKATTETPIETMTQKLDYFFSLIPKERYVFFLMLTILFVISLTVSLIFHRYPQFTLAISLLPLIQTFIMFDANLITERPMLYVILGVAHSTGCLYECIRLDRKDRKRRAAFATDLLAYTIVGFSVYVIIAEGGLATLEFENLNIVQFLLYQLFKEQSGNFSIFTYIAVAYAILGIIRPIIKDIYYIDAILSVIPLALIIIFWSAGEIPIFGSALFLLASAYAISRFSIMLTCKATTSEE